MSEREKKVDEGAPSATGRNPSATGRNPSATGRNPSATGRNPSATETLSKGGELSQKIGLWLGPILFFAILLFARFDPFSPTLTSTFEFELPEVPGARVVEGELVIRWLVQEGQEVEAGQSLAQVRTVEGAVEVSAPRSGTILRIEPGAGGSVDMGQENVVAQEPGTKRGAMLAIVALMAVWWTTQAVPIAITALLPLALYPTLGIMTARDIAPVYAGKEIFLFLGGFFIAIAMQRWNLHKRIALVILGLVGGRPRMLVLGFMIATGFLSMWISNTATAMMMLPMGLSLILLYEGLNEKGAGSAALDSRAKNFAVVLMLAIAYSASIGGVATKIGTPPNIVFAGVYGQEYPGGPEITFMRWMLLALPVTVIFMTVAWLLLSRVIFPLPPEGPISGKDFIQKEQAKLGSASAEEIKVGIVFLLTALLWMFRGTYTATGEVSFPGWTNLFGVNGPKIDDGTVAMIMGSVLFLLPSQKRQPRGGRILTWEEAARGVPWGILLLFGGGFAINSGMSSSGLSKTIVDQLQFLQGVPLPVLMASISGLSTGLTELTSNTATTGMLLPIMTELAETMGKNPLLLMIPATLAASFAFMLPVATPPNAVVFGSGRVTIAQMVKAGVILNLVGILLIVVVMLTLALPIFDISDTLPAWVGTPP